MREKAQNLLYSDNFIKLILILGFFILVLISLIIMRTPAATGYEISIYEAYPIYFWMLIISSIFIGELVLLRYALNYNGSNLWVGGALLIVISNIILLFQPIIRGYAIYGRGDVLTHIGYIKDMLVSGTIGSNPYPLDHIFFISLNLTSLFNLSDLVILIPVIFSMFFMLSMFLLARTVFESNEKVIFVLIFASLLLFGNTNSLFSPYTQSLMLFPFVLYLFFKSRGSNHKVAFSIMLILLVSFVTFFHPLSAIILILIFLLIEFLRITHQWLTRKSQWLTEKLSFSKSKFASSQNIILIAIIIFFSWGTYAYLLLKNVDRMFASLFGEYPLTSQLQSYSELLIYGQPTFITFVKTVLLTYGQYILLIAISMFAILYILKLRKSERLHFYHIFSSAGFLFFLLASFVTFVSLHVFGFTRMLFIAILFSILLTSFILDYLKKTYNNASSYKKFKIGILCVLILSITIFSTLNLYQSPFTRVANQQVSKSELGGMETFLNYRNSSFSTLELGISNYRFFEAIYGKEAPKINVFYKKRVRSVGVPDHLGYNNNSFFGSAYKSNVYIVLSTLGENSYQELYHEKEFVGKWRFSPDDFIKLNNDPSVNLIYQSGDLEIFFTNKVS